MGKGYSDVVTASEGITGPTWSLRSQAIAIRVGLNRPGVAQAITIVMFPIMQPSVGRGRGGRLVPRLVSDLSMSKKRTLVSELISTDTLMRLDGFIEMSAGDIRFLEMLLLEIRVG